MKDIKFGIVVPTRNRPQNLVNLLKSIENSKLHPAALILVDFSDFHYDLPECTFPVLFERPGIEGQVNQRNYGVNLLNKLKLVDYVLILDDDIVLEVDAISECISTATYYVKQDLRFVGFSLNIVNLKSSNDLFRKMLLYPKKPGLVRITTFNSSLCDLSQDTECDWVVGGAALWSIDFLNRHPNNYPFSGKAYGEDLFYCSQVHNVARFAASSKAKCSHIDSYSTSQINNSFYVRYNEGVSDTNLRLYLARSFYMYSLPLTIFHILWSGFLGIVYGFMKLSAQHIALALGRIAGILKQSLNSSKYEKKGKVL